MWRYVWRNKLDVLVRVVFIALFTTFFADVTGVRKTAREYWDVFKQAGYDYEGLRRSNLEMRAALEAAARIPEGCVYWYTRPSHWTRVHMRYAMCPNNRTSITWNANTPHPKYIADFAGQLRGVPDDWNRARLSGGVMLYAKPGYSFAEPVEKPRVHPAWRVFTFLLLACLETFAGFGLLSLLGISPERGGSLWFLGASFLAGFALITGAVWAGLLLGLTLRPLLVWSAALAIPALLCGAGLFPVARNARRLVSREALSANLPLSIVGIAVVSAAVYYIGLYLVPTIASPVMSFDAQSHWVYKANALFHVPTLAFSEHTHLNEYPILWPLHVAMQYMLAGGIYDELALWSIGLLLIVFLSQLAGACAMLGVRALHVWLLLPLFIVLFDESAMRWAYAETPLIAFLAAALAALCCALREKGQARCLAPAFLFACGVAGTKFEGGPMCVVLAMALAVAWPRWPLNWRAWAAGALMALPSLITLGWYAFQNSHGYVEAAHFREPVSWAKIQLLLSNIVEDVPDGWGTGWAVFVGMGLFVVLRFHERWRDPERFLLIAGLGLLLFAFVALLGWESANIRTEVYTALIRLLLHAAPALFLGVVVIMGRPPAPDTAAATVESPVARDELRTPANDQEAPTR